MPYDHTSNTVPRARSAFDWTKPVEYDENRKAAFHRAARKQLKGLADYCGWAPGTYDLRSNLAGIAVSGEITLHHELIYVSASQARLGGACGLLIRSCKGRKDYAGGTNTYAPIDLLDNIPALARRIQRLAPASIAGGSQ